MKASTFVLGFFVFVGVGMGTPSGGRAQLTEQQRLAIGEIEALGGTITPGPAFYKAGAEGPLIEGVSLSGKRFAQSSLELLEKLNLRELRSVAITNTELKGEDVAVILSQCRKLRCLTIADGAVADDALESIGDLSSLKQVVLSGTRVTSEVCRRLSGMEQLEYLALDQTCVDDDGIQYLTRLPKLWWLSLEGTKVTSAGVGRLSRAPALDTLLLHSTSIDDTALKRLAESPRLSTLRLDGTRITDRGLQHLAELKSLELIHLNDTKITVSGLKQLRDLPRLREVTVKGTSISETEVAVFELYLPANRDKWGDVREEYERTGKLPEADEVDF